MTGCVASPRQTTVVETDGASADTTASLTPLERGAIRRDALRAVEDAVDAWLDHDMARMRKLYSEQQYESFEKKAEEQREQGKVRVREHERLFFDVNDMNETGTEVSVRYVFKDKSYFESASGEQLTKPDNDESEFQIGAAKVNGQWVVIRIIAGRDRLQ